jgi:hypothetical protein
VAARASHSPEVHAAPSPVAALLARRPMARGDGEVGLLARAAAEWALRLARAARRSAIDGENGAAHRPPASNHERYWRSDRGRIGKREPTRGAVGEQASVS